MLRLYSNTMGDYYTFESDVGLFNKLDKLSISYESYLSPSKHNPVLIYYGYYVVVDDCLIKETMSFIHNKKYTPTPIFKSIYNRILADFRKLKILNILNV